MDQTKKNKHKKRKFPFKKMIIIYALYLLLFLTIFTFTDLYASYIINVFWIIPVSLILALIPTYIHYKSGERSQIDDIADELGLD